MSSTVILQTERAPASPIRAIHTPLTKLLDVKVPILLAPMSTGGGGALAAQVTKYGGFAFIPAGDDTVENLKKEVQTFKDVVKLSPATQMPVGIGFLVWYLDAGHKELLVAALDLKVKAVFFAFGDHMDRWINFVKDYDQANGCCTIIFVVVHSGAQAAAPAALRADVVVAQGLRLFFESSYRQLTRIEAGGHGASCAPPLMVQLSVVQKAIPENGPLIVAAGGIMTGSHIAALLTAGAHGCILGTRFLMAEESYYIPSQRNAMVAAKISTATERTLAFDCMVGSLGWPEGIDGRALKNLTTQEFDAGEPVEEIRAKYEVAEREGDASRIATWAGLGVGLLTQTNETVKVRLYELQSVLVSSSPCVFQDIMHELTEECFTRLKTVRMSLDN
ncbi:2-nitropropane dioxygenase [Mycena albidolilacea]|uniref:2-nitropropane dioxygenase n=1 Tax=Mycena albidolilacea TaxID=1033008 RepID=A0AAD7AQ95_9AGAR|nr:2-nitropropane dioxygenase [Mycena albidolilacea]